MLDNIKAKLLAAKTKLGSVLSAIGNDLLDTYRRCKVVLVAIGALVIALEWNKLKEYLLVKSAQSEVKSDQKQNQVLVNQENAENAKANSLVQDSENLANQEKPVTDPNWFKDGEGK